MSADKNHEQYLEEIEIAVAETTKELMEKHNADLRKIAKICAEKQVEVERLKEFQENDRKTIRSLRQQLAVATEEIDGYKEELDIAHFEYDKLKEEKYSLYLKWSEQKEEIEELKDKIENLEATNKMMKDSIKECKEGCDGGVYGLVPEELYTKAVQDINQRDFERTSLLKEIELQKDYIDAIPDKVEEYKDELHAVMGENRMLKDEIKELKKGDKRKLKKKVEELEKEIEGLNEYTSDYDTEVEMRSLAEKELEELQNEHEGICSKYHADLVELEEKREEVKKLKEEIRRNDHQACAHLREIAELKKKFVLPRTLNRHQQKMKALIIENEKLKEENKKHKEEEIEKVFGVSKEVFEKLMKECPPDPDDYK